jgi:hypothetical protein
VRSMKLLLFILDERISGMSDDIGGDIGGGMSGHEPLQPRSTRRPCLLREYSVFRRSLGGCSAGRALPLSSCSVIWVLVYHSRSEGRATRAIAAKVAASGCKRASTILAGLPLYQGCLALL